MSVKGEKYTSMSAKKRHEKTESAAMRMKEYGMKQKPVKKAAPRKMVKK